MSDLPNLCLIIVDAYRKDRLGAFEPGYEHTPNLTSRSSSWLRFADARSSAPWTLPACTSILTGVEAAKHLRYAHRHPELMVPTLAERLPAEYEKAAFVNNGNLAPMAFLDRGFETHRYSADHAKTLDATRTFLQQRSSGRPLFLLVHTNIAHDFYMPMNRPYYEGMFGSEGWFELGSRVISWNNTTAEQRASAIRAYDASVARMDSEIDRLLDLIDLDTTAVFLTADHGEGLDYGGCRVHHGGRLHEDLVGIPMMAHLPKGLVDEELAREVTRQTVGHVDIVPTMLGLAGVESELEGDGQDLFDGRHPGSERLVRSEDRKYLYLRNRHRMNSNPRGKNTTQRQRLRSRAFRTTVLRQWGVRAFVQRRHKLVVTTLVPGSAFPVGVAMPALSRLVDGEPLLARGGRAVFGFELFDLEADPEERRNLLPALDAGGVQELMPGLAEERMPAGSGEVGLMETLADALGR